MGLIKVPFVLRKSLLCFQKKRKSAPSSLIFFFELQFAKTQEVSFRFRTTHTSISRALINHRTTFKGRISNHPKYHTDYAFYGDNIPRSFVKEIQCGQICHKRKRDNPCNDKADGFCINFDWIFCKIRHFISHL